MSQELEKIEAEERLAEELKQEYSEDYPLGGMIEPYDIEREKELTEKK